MIAPEKRKDEKKELSVCPELRQHLEELVESGALGVHGRCLSDAVRAMLTQVVSRMEAGEVLEDSPYERVPSTHGNRISFRHDEAFSNRLKELMAADPGGRRATSLTSFWIELLGRGVALARVGLLWVRPVSDEATEHAELPAVEPSAVDDGQGQVGAGVDAGRKSLDQLVEEWKAMRARLPVSARADRAAGPSPLPAGTKTPQAVRTPTPDTEAEEVLAGLVRAQRIVLAFADDRPPPLEELKLGKPSQAFFEESAKLIAEMLGPDKKRRR